MSLAMQYVMLRSASSPHHVCVLAALLLDDLLLLAPLGDALAHRLVDHKQQQQRQQHGLQPVGHQHIQQHTCMQAHIY